MLLRCIYRNVYSFKYHDSRLIYQEIDPDRAKRREAASKAREGRSIFTDTPDLLEELKTEVQRSEKAELPDARRPRDLDGPIDPSPEAHVLDPYPWETGEDPESYDGIRAKMKKIEARVFPASHAALYARTPFADRYRNIITDLSDFMLMKAITENHSERKLLAQFEDKLSKLASRCKDTNFLEKAWQYVSIDFVEWLTKNRKFNLGNDNKFLETNNHLIKPRHKKDLDLELQRLEAYYIKRLKEEYGDWEFDDYDSKKVAFLQEVELPFYREKTINEAIVNNGASEQLVNDYSEIVKTKLRNTLTDEDESSALKAIKKQEKQDNKEKATRLKDPDWMAIRDAVRFHTNTTREPLKN